MLHSSSEPHNLSKQKISKIFTDPKKKKMELRKGRDNFGLSLILVVCFCSVLVSFPRSAEAYKNYTVGDSSGWYDNTEKPGVDFQKWADGKNFSLGDFLIFNTNTNHSVVQTYNATTYKLCDYDDASDNDTIQWSNGDPSNTATRPITIAVPLLKEGKTYFFSGDYDGDQCINGLRFTIAVSHGQGLPKSLQDPSDDQDGSPGPVAPRTGDSDEETAPETIVPSNFDHPKEVPEADDENARSNSSSSVALSFHVSQFLCMVLAAVLGLLLV